MFVVPDFEAGALLGATSDLTVLDGDDGDLEQVSDFDQAVSMISLTNSLVAGMEHQANLRLGLQ